MARRNHSPLDGILPRSGSSLFLLYSSSFIPICTTRNIQHSSCTSVDKLTVSLCCSIHVSWNRIMHTNSRSKSEQLMSKTTLHPALALTSIHSEPAEPQTTPYLLSSTQSSHTLRLTASSECCLLTSAQRLIQSLPWSWLENFQLGLSPTLYSWILDILANRPQSVQPGSRNSTLVLSTGAPRGCVLSPLQFTLYIHDCALWDCVDTIVKYAVNSTIICHITHNQECSYQEEIYAKQSCIVVHRNNWLLNIGKKKLMELFLQKKKELLTPWSIYISGATVEQVKCFQAPGNQHKLFDWGSSSAGLEPVPTLEPVLCISTAKEADLVEENRFLNGTNTLLVGGLRQGYFKTRASVACFYLSIGE